MKLFFRYFFRTLRLILGPILLIWEKISSPKGIERSIEAQDRVDSQTLSLVLYQYPTCPFCIKVRQQIKRLSLKIEIRNAQHDGKNRSELLAQGGKTQVPCLRIKHPDAEQTEWLYESDAIITYLTKNYS